MNIQAPEWAAKPGIYFTFADGVTSCTLGEGTYDVQGAGIIVHCDALTEESNSFYVEAGDGIYNIVVSNEKAASAVQYFIANVLSGEEDPQFYPLERNEAAEGEEYSVEVSLTPESAIKALKIVGEEPVPFFHSLVKPPTPSGDVVASYIVISSNASESKLI